MRRLTPWLSILLIVGAGLSGYFLGRQEAADLKRQADQLSNAKQKLEAQLSQEQVALFFINSTESRMFLQPVLTTIEAGADKYQAVLDALLQGPPADSGLIPVFPEGAQVRSVTLQDGLATVDLNNQAARINVGSEGELLTIASIVNTLTKLPEVYQVRILIDGQEAESLAGHVDLTETFEYNSSVVSWK